MKRTALARKTPLKSSRAPLPKVNVKAKAKRVAKQRAHYASADYRRARTQAMERAGHRCEYEVVGNAVVMGAEALHVGRPHWYGDALRCPETDRLEAHHLRYPKTRPLESRDLVIVCRAHHHLIETTCFSHRSNGR